MKAINVPGRFVDAVHSHPFTVAVVLAAAAMTTFGGSVAAAQSGMPAFTELVLVFAASLCAWGALITLIGGLVRR